MDPSSGTGRGTRPDATDDRRWRALGDPTRRAILDVLHEAPRTTGDVAARFPISRVAVMKHLDVLAEAQLVTSRKRGRERWHHVNLAPLMRLHERWSTPLAAGLAGGLVDLQRRLDRPPERPVNAEVSTIDIAMEVDIACDPATTFAAITRDPGAWWGHPFLRPEATALTLEPVLGGLLVEHWDGGGGIMATVTGITTERWLRLAGPFHLGPTSVVAELALAATDAGCRLGLGFRGSGLLDPEVADGFAAAWHELVAVRLKAFAEHGTRLGIDPG